MPQDDDRVLDFRSDESPPDKDYIVTPATLSVTDDEQSSGRRKAASRLVSFHTPDDMADPMRSVSFHVREGEATEEEGSRNQPARSNHSSFSSTSSFGSLGAIGRPPVMMCSTPVTVLDAHGCRSDSSIESLGAIGRPPQLMQSSPVRSCDAQSDLATGGGAAAIIGGSRGGGGGGGSSFNGEVASGQLPVMMQTSPVIICDTQGAVTFSGSFNSFDTYRIEHGLEPAAPTSTSRPTPAGPSQPGTKGTRRRSLLNLFQSFGASKGASSGEVHATPESLPVQQDGSNRGSKGRESRLNAARISANRSLEGRLSADRSTTSRLSADTSNKSIGRSAFRIARRKSFLDFFSDGPRASRTSASGAETEDERMNDPQRPSAKRMSRRASFIDFFRAGIGTLDAPATLGGSFNQPQQPQAERSTRRSSFIDLFRGSQTHDLGGVERPSLAAKKSGRNRRASMADIFSEASKKSFSMIKRMASSKKGGDEFSSDDEKDGGVEWHTSLDGFRSLTYCFMRREHKELYFASSVKTGEHHVLKIYHKSKMTIAAQRGLRRAFQFADSLEHENIVKVKGTWEDDDKMYMVEQYAIKGDMQADFISHPERYSEPFVGKDIMKPLLTVLQYLHGQKIVHRAVTPEHILFGRENKLLLCNFISAVDMNFELPHERIRILDYMAPEMFAVKDNDDPAAPMVFKKEDLRAEAIDDKNRRGPRRGRKHRMTASNSQLELGPETSSGQLAAEPSAASRLFSEFTAKKEPDAQTVRVRNEWEWQASYNEKVDIWQVGVLAHELLCGSVPFGAEDKTLAAALIMWADINNWPDTMSPEAVGFIQLCLTKDPNERPSAQTLLTHPWITSHVRGEVLKSQKALLEVDTEQQVMAQMSFVRKASKQLSEGFSKLGVADWFKPAPKQDSAPQFDLGDLSEAPSAAQQGNKAGPGRQAGKEAGKDAGSGKQAGREAGKEAGQPSPAQEEDVDNPFATQREARRAASLAVPTAEINKLNFKSIL